jgi:diguanylate cyclase (GGDEF)-like protein
MPSHLASSNVTSLPRRDGGAGERRRQAALDSLAIVDTQAETAYDDIARLAQTLCGTPIALVSLVDHDRQWFKARLGTELAAVPRDISFCDHTIRDPSRVMQIEDAARDPRFRGNPLVTGELESVRFYAGAPIVTREGEAVGAVCVVDRVARALTAEQLHGLAALSRQVSLLLQLRVYVNEQRAENDARDGAVRQLLVDRDDLQRRHDDLKHAAHHDPLTGLLNRTALTQLQRRPDAMARLQAGRYVLGMVDIDNFKQVNDRHGHLLGDQALRMVADTIAAAIRRSDLAVRYGGEEFLLVFPDTALAGAYEVAERIRDAVQHGHLPFPVTVSVGLAAGDPRGDTPEEVFERADQALYRAKSTGRNRVVADDTPRF